MRRSLLARGATARVIGSIAFEAAASASGIAGPAAKARNPGARKWRCMIGLRGSRSTAQAGGGMLAIAGGALVQAASGDDVTHDKGLPLPPPSREGTHGLNALTMLLPASEVSRSDCSEVRPVVMCCSDVYAG